MSWPQDDVSDDAVVGWLLRARGHSDDVSSRRHVDDLQTAATDHVVVRQLGACGRRDILSPFVLCSSSSSSSSSPVIIIEGMGVQHDAEVRHRVLVFSAYPEEGIAADGDREEDLSVGHPSGLVYRLRIEVSCSGQVRTV